MRRLRKKYKRPKTPWNMQQIEEQKKLRHAYGLPTNKEILIARQILRRYRQRARQLIAVSNETEKKLLIDKIAKQGMLKAGATLDDVLALALNSVLERRLQTVVFRKGMASSVKHARQIIVHGKVAVDGTRIKFPSYIVAAEEEEKISWYRPEDEPKKIVKPAKKGEKSEAPETDAEKIEEAAVISDGGETKETES